MAAVFGITGATISNCYHYLGLWSTQCGVTTIPQGFLSQFVLAIIFKSDNSRQTTADILDSIHIQQVPPKWRVSIVVRIFDAELAKIPAISTTGA